MSKKKDLLLSPALLAQVARLFSVLSEPSRLSLLQALHDGPLTVGELMDTCEMKQANVSKHLAVLHDHRLVSRSRNGTSVRYEISDPTIFELCSLVCGKMKRDAQQAAALFNPEI